MNYIKKTSVSLGVSSILFFVSTFIFTILQYLGWFSDMTLKILLTIFSIISFFIGGLIFGKKSLKKGWLEGIKLSFINIILFLLLNVLLSNFQIKNTIFYLLIFFFTTLGSIIGVNKKA